MGAISQVKFTIESGVVAAFKACCASEGVSMAAAARQWMMDPHPAKNPVVSTSTRPNRRKAVQVIIGLLTDVLDAEAEYRDNIPEQFAQRHEAAEHACAMLEEAITYLEDAF